MWVHLTYHYEQATRSVLQHEPEVVEAAVRGAPGAAPHHQPPLAHLLQPE